MPRATTLLSGAVYAAPAVADSVAAGRSSASARRLRYVLKPALMPALATAFLGGTRDGSARAGTDLLRTGTAAAQAFSWGGDVALLGGSERSFLTGVGSFFGGARRLPRGVPVGAWRGPGPRCSCCPTACSRSRSFSSASPDPSSSRSSWRPTRPARA